jgi:hypothetical protein
MFERRKGAPLIWSQRFSGSAFGLGQAKAEGTDNFSIPIVQGTTLNSSPMSGTYFPEKSAAPESIAIWNLEDWTEQHFPNSRDTPP